MNVNNEISPDFYDIEYYLSMELRYLSGAHQAKIDLLKKILTDVKGKRVLDLGCGGGFFSNMVRDMGADVLGVDYSESAISFSKDRYPDVDFEIANAQTLEKIADESFDVVLLIDVIEHIKDQRKTLIEIRRILKHGGRIVISTDLEDSAWNKPFWASLIWRSYIFSKYGRAYRLIKKVEASRRLRKNYHDSHVSIKTKEELRKLLNVNHFRVDKLIVYPLVRVSVRDFFLKFLPIRYRGDHVMISARKA